METIKSYQEKVQASVDKAISAVENKQGEIAGLVYGKVRDVNKLFGEKAGELILKFEKPETTTAKAKKKVTAAKAATAKATKAVIEKVEEATA